MNAQTSPVTRRYLLGGLASAASAQVLAPRFAGAQPRATTRADQIRRPGMSDREVIARALSQWQFNGGGVFQLEADRTYELGSVDRGPDLFSIGGLSGAVLDGNGATLVARSQEGLAWNLLSFSGVADLTIRNLAFRDRAYRGDAWGMKALVLQPGATGTSGVALDGVRAQSVLSLVQTQGPEAPARVRGLVFGAGCVARNSYYALCCQDQGDAVSGRLSAIDCRRAYFAHGVTDHRLGLDIAHGCRAPAARSPVLVKSYGRPTEDIALDIRYSGCLPWGGRGADDPGACVMLEHQSPPGRSSLIRGVDLNLLFEPGLSDPRGPSLLALTSIAADGRVERRTSNRWDRVAISVNGAGPRRIDLPSDPLARTVLAIGHDRDPVSVNSLAPNISVANRS